MSDGTTKRRPQAYARGAFLLAAGAGLANAASAYDLRTAARRARRLFRASPCRRWPFRAALVSGRKRRQVNFFVSFLKIGDFRESPRRPEASKPALGRSFRVAAVRFPYDPRPSHVVGRARQPPRRPAFRHPKFREVPSASRRRPRSRALRDDLTAGGGRSGARSHHWSQASASRSSARCRFGW
jgi:hypothetical protein